LSIYCQNHCKKERQNDLSVISTPNTAAKITFGNSAVKKSPAAAAFPPICP
jgi:hypothetical protein